MSESDLNESLEKSLNQEDPLKIFATFTPEQLLKLKQTEELLELRHKRKKRQSRFLEVSQAMVGYIALVGIFANAYQTYINKQQQTKQATIEQERWSKEFDRARQADRYRAFFETSMLATDASNSDKRLVGYSLLQEFVDDKDYNSKATLALEESLMQVLRNDVGVGLTEAHRNAVVAIITSLSQSSDCRALERAARSIEKIARRHAQTQDIKETEEVFGVYLRRVMGRAALVCPTLAELRQVQRPLAETASRIPEIVGLAAPLSVAAATTRLVELLRLECRHENSVIGGSECPAIFRHYAKLCADIHKTNLGEFEAAAASCAIAVEAAK